MGNSCRDLYKYPQRLFFLCNQVKYWDVTLEFRQYISFVALVIIGMISDLHLGGKRMSRFVTANGPSTRSVFFHL